MACMENKNNHITVRTNKEKMKKYFYSMALGMFLLPAALQAQTGPMVMNLPYTCLEYKILHLSPNGKWACGVIDNGTFSGWVWNLTTGQLTELTQVGVASTAWQVSDDGIVAGTFLDTRATGNGAPVESSGYWTKGHWYHLGVSGGGMVTDVDHAGQANAISANGRYIGGQVVIGGEYKGVVWDMQNNGVMTALPNNDTGSNKGGAAFSVDNNGHAAGWTYGKRASVGGGGTTINRTAALWMPELIMPQPDKVDFYCAARLSPNGRYAIVNSSIYDTATGKSTPITGAWDYELFAITDEGVCVGMYQASMSDAMTGCVVIDGKFKDINKYLKEKGVDLGHYSIAQVVGVSEDGKTFGAMAYNTSVGGEMALIDPIVVKLDENITTREPAGVDAMALEGAYSVRLDWRKPLAGAAGVTGYELYRDGELLNTFGPDVFSYTDTGVAKGTHSYTAAAVYGSVKSVLTDAAEVTVEDKSISRPRDLMGLQARVNDVRLLWDVPESPLPSLRYYDGDEEVNGIGWNKYSIESGTRFTADLLAAYGEGAKIEGVTFYPMSPQMSWRVSVYAADDTNSPLCMEIVDNSALNFGMANTVKFKTPLAVPAGKDLIIGVTAVVDPAGAGSYNTFGRITGKKRIGYSDLMRRVGVDKDFFSMYELSMSRPGNEAEDNTTWPVSALISNAAAADNAVTGYKVFENGGEIASVTGCEATLKTVTDGEHTYGVAAVYADGNMSDPAETRVSVTANTGVYDITGLTATADGLTVTAEWSAPVNDDATDVTYAKGPSAGGMVGSENFNYSYTVGAKYSGRMLKAYKGYEIKSFRFYPLAKAYFSFTLTANGEVVAYRDIEDGEYTVGRWNTIALDEAVELDPNAEYLLALECFEPAPGETPIALDGYMSYVYAGDLYKQGDDEFLSLNVEGGNVGNWMIGMVVGTPESEDLGVLGYNVRMGDKFTGETLLTDSPVSDTRFSHTFDKAGTYTLRVSPVYGEPVGERQGQTVTCRVSVPEGISDVTADGVRVYPNPATTYVKADGDVLSITAYSLSGAKAAHAAGNTLDVSGLEAGIYLVKVVTPEDEFNTKVTVKK